MLRLSSRVGSTAAAAVISSGFPSARASAPPPDSWSPSDSKSLVEPEWRIVEKYEGTPDSPPSASSSSSGLKERVVSLGLPSNEELVDALDEFMSAVSQANMTSGSSYSDVNAAIEESEMAMNRARKVIDEPLHHSSALIYPSPSGSELLPPTSIDYKRTLSTLDQNAALARDLISGMAHETQVWNAVIQSQTMQMFLSEYASGVASNGRAYGRESADSCEKGVKVQEMRAEAGKEEGKSKAKSPPTLVAMLLEIVGSKMKSLLDSISKTMSSFLGHFGLGWSTSQAREEEHGAMDMIGIVVVGVIVVVLIVVFKRAGFR